MSGYRREQGRRQADFVYRDVRAEIIKHSDVMLGMGCAFPLRPLAESASQIMAPEWDGLSGSAPRGNCVPESSLRLGRTFRIGLQAEAASRILAPEWDAVSG